MHNENHYITAQDLASIMKYCMKNDNFRKLAGSASCAIHSTNKYNTRKYISTNELIVPDNINYYPYITAGKTGYTSQAGDCLVSCSYKDKLTIGFSSSFFNTDIQRRFFRALSDMKIPVEIVSNQLEE